MLGAGSSSGTGRDFADRVSQQNGAVLGHVPVVTLSLVEVKKGPSAVLDRNSDVKGSFEIQDGKLDGTPCVGQAEKVNGNPVWPWSGP